LNSRDGPNYDRVSVCVQLCCCTEIVAGDVFINHNPLLCHVHSINWADILTNHSVRVVVNYTDTSSERCQSNGL